MGVGVVAAVVVGEGGRNESESKNVRLALKLMARCQRFSHTKQQHH